MARDGAEASGAVLILILFLIIISDRQGIKITSRSKIKKPMSALTPRVIGPMTLHVPESSNSAEDKNEHSSHPS